MGDSLGEEKKKALAHRGDTLGDKTKKKESTHAQRGWKERKTK